MPIGLASVVLGPAGSGVAACDITLTLTVVKLPAIDAVPATAGQQTYQSASADAAFQGAAGGITVENGIGRDVTTVNPGNTPPPPPPIVVPPPPLAPPPPPATAPGKLDHFKCYEAVQPNFRQRTVGTRDQFGQRRTRVLRTRQICNPVSKNQGKVLQPRAHLVCYETRDQTRASFSARCS